MSLMNVMSVRMGNNNDSYLINSFLARFLASVQTARSRFLRIIVIVHKSKLTIYLSGEHISCDDMLLLLR